MRFSTPLFLVVILGVALTTQALHFENENEILIYIKNNLLPKNPSILEAGGHYGTHTKMMKNVWPQSTMYVFEPLESSFAKLRKATHSLKDVYYYNYALSSYQGTTNFYINPRNTGASSIAAPVPDREKQDSLHSPFNEVPIKVNCTTIANWAAHHEITNIDFMWLDMEGHELEALTHAENILDTVKVIYTEINFVEIRQGSCLYQDLKHFLEKKGFRELWQRTVFTIKDEKIQGDALFVKGDSEAYSTYFKLSYCNSLLPF